MPVALAGVRASRLRPRVLRSARVLGLTVLLAAGGLLPRLAGSTTGAAWRPGAGLLHELPVDSLQGPGLPPRAAARGPWAQALSGPPEGLLQGVADLIDRLHGLEAQAPDAPSRLLDWAEAVEAGPAAPWPPAPARCPELPADPGALDGRLPPDLPLAWREALRPVVAGLHAAELARTLLWTGPDPVPRPAEIVAALQQGLAGGATPPLAAWAQGLNAQALRDGARALACAAQALRRVAAGAAALPVGQWRHAHADGEVLIDARPGHAGEHALARPWLVLDLDGDDQYQLGDPEVGPQAGVKLLLDAHGDDQVLALAPAGDAASALLGFALHWDLGQGHDRHAGGWLAQGAAVLGAALALDGGGPGAEQAQGLAQGAALAGWALKQGSAGPDRREALTLAQAAAGPGGLALLLEPGGDDDYRLRDQPLAWPSAQDPARPVSMGQGAAFGLRAGAGPAAVPGRAVLLDRGGDDRHEAAVFAQGVALWGGLGLWVHSEGGGTARADWHAQGAAAHGGLGLMAWGEPGPRSVQAHRVQAQGAGHDQGWGIFLAAGGQGLHAVQDLGLGSGHAGGWGHFLHRGAPVLALGPGPCRGGGRAADGVAGSRAWAGLGPQARPIARPGPACGKGHGP